MFVGVGVAVRVAVDAPGTVVTAVGVLVGVDVAVGLMVGGSITALAAVGSDVATGETTTGGPLAHSLRPRAKRARHSLRRA